MSPKAAAPNETLDALIFIDTNIFLDLYRVRGWEGGLSVLDHISANHERIITGSQIEMEFKKNPQRVILDSLGKAKSPDWAGLNIPTFLQDSKPNRVVTRARRDIDAQMKRMRARIERVLKNPATNHPVFRVAQALFRSDSVLNLSLDKDARYRIRRLALKRFMLGYPPRKDGDTSIGDAINWEWIIRCAADTGKHVIIVSRDSDYGHSYQKAPVLNDWLRQEFAERVSRKRKLLLTDRLTEGFKRIAVPVTEEEEAEEDALLTETTESIDPAIVAPWLARLLSPDEFRIISLTLGLADKRSRQPDEAAKELGLSHGEASRLLKSAGKKIEADMAGRSQVAG